MFRSSYTIQPNIQMSVSARGCTLNTTASSLPISMDIQLTQRIGCRYLNHPMIKPHIRNQLLRGIEGLKHPPFRHPDMNTEARLLHACLYAYQKHACNNPDIGWDDLSTVLLNAICEAVGDGAFVQWNEGMGEDTDTNT